MPHTYSTCLGRLALFNSDLAADRADRLSRDLTPRQIALLVSALNFHALDNPGVSLRIVVHVAAPGRPSHLTDAGTRHSENHTGAAVVAEFSIASTVAGTPHPHFLHVRKAWEVDPETGVRNIVLDAEHDPEHPQSGGRPNLFWWLRGRVLYWWLRGRVERRFPFQYDSLRQWLLRGREASLHVEKIKPREVDLPLSTLATETETETATETGDREQAVIFGLHWLELGGAERWAIESIALAREHGLRPIVITDVPSAHPWIMRAELAGAIVLILTHPVEQPEHSEPVLEAVAANFDVRGVFVHHSRWLYDRLPWLRMRLPGVPVVTTHHILEYNGGGYPAIGAALDDFIDVHHVISPQLDEWLVGVQGINPDKVALAPLVGLTTSGPVAAAVKTRVDADALTLGYIGRFAPQKRPYLFTKLVRTLREQGVPLRVVMQGGGDLEQFVRRDISGHGLDDLVEWVGEGAPVHETLARIDALVLSSQNEGLTLTTLEALAAGVPVISTDVGSQRTIIVPQALVAREPRQFLTEAAAVVTRMSASEEFRTDVWQAEMARAHEFTTHISAHDWAGKLFDQWSK